ncbi:unnamed protein product, partial [Laminaria digitata]
RFLFTASSSTAVFVPGRWHLTWYFSVSMHFLLLFYVIMAWITGGVTHTITRGLVTGRTATLLRGEGFEKKVEGQREQAGRETFLCTNNGSSSEQKHRTAFCALKHARS